MASQCTRSAWISHCFHKDFYKTFVGCDSSFLQTKRVFTARRYAASVVYAVVVARVSVCLCVCVSAVVLHIRIRICFIFVFMCVN